MDHQHSSPLRHTQHPAPVKHICSLCGKSRSKRYRDQHPLTPSQVLEPSICSRSKCAKAVNELLRSPREVIFYETHYHYHSSSTPEGPPPSYAAVELQLPHNMLHGSRREESPPVNFSSRPEDIAVELSGKNSVAGRVELPGNRCSRRAFRGLTSIPEESPPPVNFLKKPTLQKNRKGSED